MFMMRPERFRLATEGDARLGAESVVTPRRRHAEVEGLLACIAKQPTAPAADLPIHLSQALERWLGAADGLGDRRRTSSPIRAKEDLL